MSRARSLAPAFCLVLLVACDAMPRDIEGTRGRVESSQIIWVGLLDSAISADNRERIVSYLQRLGRETGARPRVAAEAGEPVLAQLQDGQLDLVIGEVASDSPWRAQVAVIEPLSERGVAEHRIGLSPIARNGENRWIMLLEKAVRDLRSGA